VAPLRIDRYLIYSAIQHFYRTNPISLDSVSRETWERVAPVLLHMPDTQSGDLERSVHIVAQAFRAAPDAVRAAVEAALREPSPEGIIFTRKLRLAWDRQLADLVLKAIRSGLVTPAAARDALASLIVAGRKEAMTFARRAVRVRAGSGPNGPLAIACAQALLAAAQDGGFDAIWPLIQASVHNGRSILGANEPHSEALATPLVLRLNERQLGDLYLWLRKNRPEIAQSPTGRVGPGERLERLERETLDRLRSIGTIQAVDQIVRIRNARPNDSWLSLTLDDAERSMRLSNKIRPSPAQILRLAEDASKTYVSCEEDLLEAILVSLKRLDQELTGEDPLARFLWQPGPRHRDEMDLSIFTTVHLRRDLRERGVVLNREVNVTRISRTDIRVEAVSVVESQPPTSVAVTIEVKGSWHPKLKSAMKDQLRDQYLARGTGKTGLYLIGWFRTERRGLMDGPRMTIEQARSLFDQQAAMLSTQPYILRAHVLDCRWTEEKT